MREEMTKILFYKKNFQAIPPPPLHQRRYEQIDDINISSRVTVIKVEQDTGDNKANIESNNMLRKIF